MNMELADLIKSCWVWRLKLKIMSNKEKVNIIRSVLRIRQLKYYQLTMSSPFSEEHSNLLANSTAASWGLLWMYWSQSAFPDKAIALQIERRLIKGVAIILLLNQQPVTQVTQHFFLFAKKT